MANAIREDDVVGIEIVNLIADIFGCTDGIAGHAKGESEVCFGSAIEIDGVEKIVAIAFSNRSC